MTTTIITWETDEKLACTNCDTIYPLVLISTNGVNTEEPCPGCGRSDTNTWAD
jgi:hypothetical protein